MTGSWAEGLRYYWNMAREAGERDAAMGFTFTVRGAIAGYRHLKRCRGEQHGFRQAYIDGYKAGFGNG